MIPAAAQPRAVAERQAEFARVQDELNDPDANVRLAYMEQIVGSDDAARIGMAIRIGATSDDRALRSLALRAFLASRRLLSFEMTLPEAAQRLLAGNEAQAAQALQQAGLQPQVRMEQQYSGLLPVLLKDVQVERLTGAAFLGQNTEQFAGTLTVTADALVTESPVYGYNRCVLRAAVQPGGILGGTIRCQDWRAPLAVQTRMF